MKDAILKLANNKSYYILEELDYNNKKYAFASECNLEKETLNEDEFVVMEVKLINDELVVDEIYDDKVAEEVTLLFKKKFQEQ